MTTWGGKSSPSAQRYQAVVSLAGLSGETVDLQLSPAMPGRYILLGGYVTFDAAPESTDPDTDSLQVGILGIDIGLPLEAIGLAEVGFGYQACGYRTGSDLQLQLSAWLGADTHPGELSHIAGATTATVTLWYLP